MKKKTILLLLSLAGLVVFGFFFLADFLTPERLADESVKNPLTNPAPSPERRLTESNPVYDDWRNPKPDFIAYSPGNHEEEQSEESQEAEEETVERVEAREAEEEDGENEEGLEPEQEEALDQFLAQIAPENWRQARAALLAVYKEGVLPKSAYVEERFWSRVGETGGRKVANELLESSNPALTKILKGWGKADPQALLDYFLELDLEDQKMQNYLARTNNRELPFLDQFSSGILDGLAGGDKGEGMEGESLNKVSEVVDYFLENAPLKGESLMREFTERVIENQNLDSLKEWVSAYEKPTLQAATAQRVIESGAFDERPLDAVEFAHSLSSEKAQRTALSSAYARLANGVNGHNPHHTALELNAMDAGPERDFALNGFAHGLVHQDPEAALEWANEISNEGFRKVVTQNISKRIKKELPDTSGDEN